MGNNAVTFTESQLEDYQVKRFVETFFVADGGGG